MPLSHDPAPLERAIIAERGSVSRGARAIGISKGYAFEIMKTFKLNAWARQLRKSMGLPVRGRQPLPSRKKRRTLPP